MVVVQARVRVERAQALLAEALTLDESMTVDEGSSAAAEDESGPVKVDVALSAGRSQNETVELSEDEAVELSAIVSFQAAEAVPFQRAVSLATTGQADAEGVAAAAAAEER